MTQKDGPLLSPAAVVIATRGRPTHVYRLLDCLQAQTAPALKHVVVGTGPEDIAGLEAHTLVTEGRAALILASRPGLTIQRNAGLDWLSDSGGFEPGEIDFVVFFDDDFRPRQDWLQRCGEALAADPAISGLTGRVLADGVNGPGLSESEAEAFLSGAAAPWPHWSDMPSNTPVSSAYGCNMAFSTPVARSVRFDEALPLYGWQEDCDYTGQAKAFGEVVVWPACVGVHLGVKSGRVSGLRFGYSQIANPLRIAARGNMPKRRALRFMFRALAANTLKSMIPSATFDYPGRLRGNCIALIDLLLGRCHPNRIVELG